MHAMVRTCCGEDMLSRHSGNAAARTYDDMMDIRKRHFSLHISRASCQGTHLGSEGGRHCLPPASVSRGQLHGYEQQPLALPYPDPHFLLLQTPRPGGITVCGNWLITMLLLPKDLCPGKRQRKGMMQSAQVVPAALSLGLNTSLLLNRSK